MLEIAIIDGSIGVPKIPCISFFEPTSTPKPSAHIVAAVDAVAVARCSIWFNREMQLDEQPVGVIGHYAAVDAAVGKAVLQRALRELAEYGARRVVGPMDGSTWRSYRFVTDRGSEPAFFLEPSQPDEWPLHFTNAGFEPLAHYTSAINDDLSVTDPRVARAMSRFTADGGCIEPIDLSRFDDELRAVHELSVTAFAHNFLYTPIEVDDFIAMYQSLRQRIVPQLVLLARRKDQLVGFMFGIPDLLEQQRIGSARTAIAKTLAVLPGRAGAGLGTVLLNLFQQNARLLGFSRVIHALMHDGNRSVKISAHFGRTMRRYTLFSKAISS